MSRADLDLDLRLSELESEWRLAYEASISARADYQRLAAMPGADVALLDSVRERQDRAEACKARIMERMERLEAELLGQSFRAPAHRRGEHHGADESRR